jgi:hypothetical protein
MAYTRMKCTIVAWLSIGIARRNEFDCDRIFEDVSCGVIDYEVVSRSGEVLGRDILRW